MKLPVPNTHYIMNFENLIYSIETGIVTITINRESKLNALNIQTLKEIKEAVLSAQLHPEVKGIILTGAGSKAFAAGADISEFANFTVQQGTEMSAAGHEVMNTIENCKVPVIAAVNGFALGGGCELAMACHIRIASENAKFGQPEVNLGVIPGYGGTQRLVRYIGKSRATELLLTGDAINAATALQFGLVNYVVSAEELLVKCNEVLNKVASKSPINITQILKLVNDHYLGQGFENEIGEFGHCFGTLDFKVGTQAFLNKQKPEFKGS